MSGNGIDRNWRTNSPLGTFQVGPHVRATQRTGRRDCVLCHTKYSRNAVPRSSARSSRAIRRLRRAESNAASKQHSTRRNRCRLQGRVSRIVFVESFEREIGGSYAARLSTFRRIFRSAEIQQSIVGDENRIESTVLRPTHTNQAIFTLQNSLLQTRSLYVSTMVLARIFTLVDSYAELTTQTYAHSFILHTLLVFDMFSTPLPSLLFPCFFFCVCRFSAIALAMYVFMYI